MSSRHQTNAKNHERRTCQALGGERNGPNPGSDCVGTPYSVECKRQAKLSLRADHLDQARRQSKSDGKPWILVQQEHGSTDPVLTCDFKWFAQEIHPLYMLRNEPGVYEALKAAHLRIFGQEMIDIV